MQHARHTHKSAVPSGIHAISDNTSVVHLNLLDLAGQQFRGLRLRCKKKKSFEHITAHKHALECKYIPKRKLGYFTYLFYMLGQLREVPGGEKKSPV